MSSFGFVIIHQGHERKEINLCLAALLCDQLLPIREILIKFFSTDVVFFAVHSAVPGQSSSCSILSKLPTIACWFRKNVG